MDGLVVRNEKCKFPIQITLTFCTPVNFSYIEKPEHKVDVDIMYMFLCIKHLVLVLWELIKSKAYAFRYG